ncbi:MAG: hypothetical protein ACR2HY_10595 [Acidimicrobiales bacterium]
MSNRAPAPTASAPAQKDQGLLGQPVVDQVGDQNHVVAFGQGIPGHHIDDLT